MSAKINVSICRGHELANALYVNTDIQRPIDWLQLSDDLRISHGKVQLSSKHHSIGLGHFDIGMVVMHFEVQGLFALLQGSS